MAASLPFHPSFTVGFTKCIYLLSCISRRQVERGTARLKLDKPYDAYVSAAAAWHRQEVGIQLGTAVGIGVVARHKTPTQKNSLIENQSRLTFRESSDAILKNSVLRALLTSMLRYQEPLICKHNY